METAARGYFCYECYAASIARVCSGYTILKNDRRRPVTVVPPLDAVIAASVRQAAREYIEAHGPGDSARHPHHTRGTA